MLIGTRIVRFSQYLFSPNLNKFRALVKMEYYTTPWSEGGDICLLHIVVPNLIFLLLASPMLRNCNLQLPQVTSKMYELSPSNNKKKNVDNLNSLKAHQFLIRRVCQRKIPSWKIVGSPWKEGIVRLVVDKVIFELQPSPAGIPSPYNIFSSVKVKFIVLPHHALPLLLVPTGIKRQIS